MNRSLLPALKAGLSRLHLHRRRENPSGQTWPRSERRVAERRRQIGDFRHREARLQAVAQIGGIGAYDFDFATGSCYWSAEAKAIAGLSVEAGETAWARMAAIAHPEDRERFMQAVEASLDLQGEGHFEAEYRILRPDGALRWIRVRGQTFFAGDAHERRALGASGVIIDITGQKEAEEALRASEEKYRILFNNMNEGLSVGEAILDSAGNAVDHRFLAVNNAFYAQTGISDRNLEGHRMLEYFPLVEQSEIDRYAAVARTGQPDRFINYNSDTRRHYDIYAFSPGPGQWALLFRDITAQKLEDELRTFKVFSDHSSEDNLIADAKGRIRYVNRRLCESLGYSEEEVFGLHIQDILPNATPALFWEIVERTKTGNMEPFESVRQRKDGTLYPVEVSATGVEVNGEWLVFSVSRDIGERKRAEAALRASEEKYRTLFANMTEGFLVAEPIFDSAGNAVDHRYLAVNDAFHMQTGIPKGIEGRRMREFFPQAEQSWIDRFAAVARTGQPDRFDNYDADTRRYYDVYAFCPGPGRFAVLFRDITEKKRAEQALRESEERFRLLYENAPIGIVISDGTGHILSANRKFAEIAGYSSVEETIGLSHQDVALREDRAEFVKRAENIFSGLTDTFKREGALLRKDGSTAWVRATVKMLRDESGKPQWGIVIHEDISERKQAEDAMRQSEEKFRATFEHAPLGVMEATVDGRIVEVNSKLVEMLGYSKEEFARLTIGELTHPSERENSLAKLQKLAAGEADSYVMENRYFRKNRSFVWVSVTASLAPVHGKPRYLVVTVEDITARKKAEEDLKRAMESSYHQATHDMLTGLANRASFHDRLKEALAYAKRDEHRVAIHLLDLDRFKSINDTLGHDIGDLLLKEVAQRIKSHVRATDLAARLGGDEFVVIQTHFVDPAAAGVLAEKLLQDLGRTYVLDKREVQSGASIGIAVFPGDAENPDELIKHADLALYEAKHRGRFNYQFYRQELGAALLETQRLEQELKRAVRKNEFCLHYQPQFDLKNGGRISGIEALLRWRHPERGMLSAAEFFLDAEHAKLMLPIGEWTLLSACRQYKTWIDAGLAVPLTLNLSALQLRDPRLLETLKHVLEETGLPAAMLQLEMRESVLWDPKFSKKLLNQMKENGLRLALDDFGADLTTLPSLDKFPLDAVKPSQSLVRKLPSHPREAALLAAIIGVAHDLNMAVCADGVETDDQFAAVKKQGCDSVQGYLLSSPLDAKRMKHLIDAELIH